MSITPTRVLVLLNALALTGLAYLWVDSAGYLRPIVWLPPSPILANITPLTIVGNTAASDPGALAATLARPLFAPDRRPPPPVLPPPPPPPPDPLADVKLLGLFSGEVSGVLLKSEGRVRRISLNQKLGQWTLQGIDERSATFARSNEKRVIRLEYARLNTSAPPVAKAPAPTNVADGGTPAASPQVPMTSRLQEEAAKERIREEIRARSAK